ncbi:YbaK/EbsC family protein [Pararhizobium haloflavum]|uniref:YbaK/EbsC family protein n=1 Tax=Pararhizobium haloflavum TaxID=2037914 RepID=UPI000C18DD4E|nr:YbaK/EbsC family protein [Pararhizobium haloflavum]
MDDSAPKTSAERVALSAARLGLAINLQVLDQSTRTADEAAKACGCGVAQIIKSLVFVDTLSDRLILILVSGANTVDIDAVGARCGVRLERCDPRRVREQTGFAIGGVAPIGHLNPIRTLMDRTLLDHSSVFAAAGRPDSVFEVDAGQLADATSAELVDVVSSHGTR